MYIEIKTPASGRKYVYLKRSVRVNGRVKHITVERFGELNELLALDPNIIEKLNEQCRAGSPDLFASKLHAFEHNLAAAMKNSVSSEYAVTSPDGRIPTKTRILGEQRCGVKTKTTKASESELRTTNLRGALTPSVSLLLATPPTALQDKELRELCAVYGLQDLNEDDSGSIIQEQRLIDVVVPAAGVGSRMGADVPKQYLKLDDKCVLEHTVLKLLTSPYVRNVIVVLSHDDPFFKYTCLLDLDRVVKVDGGKERVDSVLAGLMAAQTPWVMVHDAARPLISLIDIEQLLVQVAHTQLDPTSGYCGGILVAPMADTVKQAQSVYNGARNAIDCTIDRSHLFRALTPQLFLRDELIDAIKTGQAQNAPLTDESSAMELLGKKVLMVEGSPLNFKLTQPSDLMLTKALINYLAPNY